MSKRRPVRKARTFEHLRHQALGLAVMLVALGGAFAGSRAYQVHVEEPAEPAQTTAEEIATHIQDVSARYGIDPRLVAAIIAVESEFDPNAVSRRGAEGLMQLMPETAASLDVQDSFDVHDNIEGGVRHLRRLMNRFGSDIPLVLAAYNAGEQAVLTYHGIPPYRETRRYVVQVLFRYDRDAARAVARRFTSPATAKPAFARATRVMYVAPAASARVVGAVGAEARSLSPASLPTSLAVSAPTSRSTGAGVSSPASLSAPARHSAPPRWSAPSSQAP